jgi:hypothetical protein
MKPLTPKTPAELRAAVSSTPVGRADKQRVLSIEAIGFVQGTDPRQRASVDVQAETTRFEVVIRERNGSLYEVLAGGGDEWLTKEGARRYAQGFLQGIAYGS